MRSRLVILIALLTGLLAFSAPASAQDICTFTVLPEAAPLYHAPLADPMQQKGILPAGGSYRVISRSGPQYDALFLVALDDAYGGWVDPRSGTLNGPCDAVPIDDMPLASYPTICALTAASPVPFFDDAALSLGKGALDPGTYVVTRRSGDALFVRLDHAMGGYVAAGAGSLSQACESLPSEHPPLATTGPNARVWSAPDVRSGHILASLPVGSRVLIEDGPVHGPIRADTDDQGDWFLVHSNDDVVGWVWSQRLVFDAPMPLTDAPTAITLDNARLWTVPNVHAGYVVAFLDAGLPLHVLSEPGIGPIRHDTDDMGEWYYVQPVNGPLAGWLWTERMTER